MSGPVLADVAVLTCTPMLGEHSDECLAFNESRSDDPVCIEANGLDGPLPGGDVERVPAPAVPPTARWRSQGITVYDSDDERLERLARLFKDRGVRFGRRGQISLLAGAGIAALERLLAVDPTALVSIVEGTLRERAGKTSAFARFATLLAVW